MECLLAGCNQQTFAPGKGAFSCCCASCKVDTPHPHTDVRAVAEQMLKVNSAKSIRRQEGNVGGKTVFEAF
eukprot:576558-Amphidinium_carterae.2